MEDEPMGTAGAATPAVATTHPNGSDAPTKALPTDRRRVELLDAASRLASSPDFGEQDWLSPVRRVTLHDVAESLGKSRTWAYRLWTARDEFWRDLAVFVTARPDAEVESLVATAPTATAMRAVGGVAWFAGRVAEAATTGIGHAGSACRIAISGHRPPAVIVAANRLRRVRAIELIAEWTDRWLSAASLLLKDGIELREFAQSIYVLVCGGRTAVLFQHHIVDPQVWATTIEHAVGELLDAVCVPARAPVRPVSIGERTDDVSIELPAWTGAQLEVLERAHELLLREPDPTSARISALGSLTVSRLARFARVHRSTVYRIWPNEDLLKIDLLVHITDRRVDLAVGLIRALMPDEAIDPMQLAATYATWISRQLYEADPALSMMFAADLTHPAVVRALRKRYRQMLPRVDEAIAGDVETDETRTTAARGLLVWYGGRELAPPPGEAEAGDEFRFAVALIVATLGLTVRHGQVPEIDVAGLRQHLSRLGREAHL